MSQRIIIIDNHPLIRLTVLLLMKREGFEVVGEAYYGADAIDLIQRLQPEMVILDLELPGVEGCMALYRLAEKFPAVKFVVLTAQDSDQIAIGCLRAGACGFIKKRENLSELVDGVREIANGGRHFPTDIIKTNKNKACSAKHVDKLSVTELKILQEVSLGLSNRQIAERLSLSVKFVSAAKANILIKLNSSTSLCP